MANYADILNVICLYSHSLHGSTVLPTTLYLDCVVVALVVCSYITRRNNKSIGNRCRSETAKNFITKLDILIRPTSIRKLTRSQADARIADLGYCLIGSQ